MINITGTPQQIINQVANKYPEIEQLLFNAHIQIPKYKGSMQPYQAAVLYMLAKDRQPQNVLEVGTGVGYSTFFLANGYAYSNIFTINPNIVELKLAQLAMGNDHNIEFLHYTSREYTDVINKYRNNRYFDFILIDGDHKDIEFDLNWYNRLNPNGLILFHDYTDTDSHRPQKHVYDILTKHQYNIGSFDILVKDTENNYGMAGWIKNE